MRTLNRAIVVLAIICFLLITTSKCDAARLPDWASAIANQEWTGDTQESSESFQLLLSQRAMTFHPNGRVTVVDRIAKRALRGASNDVGAGSIALGSTWKLEKARAWHQPPGKRAKKSRKDSMFELSDTSVFLSDNRARGVVIPNIVEDSLIFFEFHAEWSPYALSFTHSFTDEGSVVNSKLVIDVPAGWTVKYEWTSGNGPEPSADGSEMVWQLQNITVPEPEPLSDRAEDGLKLLAISIVPPDDFVLESTASFRSWGDVSLWMSRLIDDRGEVDRASCEAWLGDDAAEDDPLIQVVTAALAVRDSVRYVAKEVGIGGYQPRPAAETSATLWGDCKDKSILLQAVLANQGINAFPVLVNASSSKTVAERIPTLDAFNHAITAIELGERTVPPHLKNAIVEDEIHGRLLIVDTTDAYTSPGSLSRNILGHRALIIDGSRGSLVTLPGTNPEDHRLDETLTAIILDDDSVSFSRVREYVGQPASSYRAGFRTAQTSWRDRIEKEIRDQWIGAHVDSFEVQEETAEGRTVERISWTVDSLPGGGERVLELFAQIAGELPRVTLRRRKLPVVYDYPRIVRSTVHVEGLPEEFVVPKARTTVGEGWRLETTYQSSPHKLTASFEIILERRRFEVVAMTDLRKLYSGLAALKRISVVVGLQQ